MNQQLSTLVNFIGVQAVFIYDNLGSQVFAHSTLIETSPILRSVQNLSKSVANSKKRGHQIKDIHLKLGKSEVLARGIKNGFVIIVVDKNINKTLFETAYNQAVGEIDTNITTNTLTVVPQTPPPTPTQAPKIEEPPAPAPKPEPPKKKTPAVESEVVWYNFALALDNLFNAEEGKIGIQKNILSKWANEHSIRKLHEVEIRLSDGQHIRMKVSPREHLKENQVRLAPSDAKRYGLKAGDNIGVHPLLV